MLEAVVRTLQTWPGTPTPTLKRKRATFRASWQNTLDLIEKELRYLKAKDVIIEAYFDRYNIRNDGWPRHNASPVQPGVILNFQSIKGALRYPCDHYDDWHDNLRAIGLALQALRAVDRYGVTRHNEQYRGWQSLPCNTGAGPMQPVDAGKLIIRLAGLNGLDPVSVSKEEWVTAYRKAAIASHPDSGGTEAQFKALNEAKRLLQDAKWMD